MKEMTDTFSSPEAQVIADEFKKFAYIVSHDLNTPLRTMVEFSRLLQTEKPNMLDEEGEQYLALIIDAGERLQLMMNGLLEFSRLSTMAKPFSRVACNVVLDQCLLVLQKEIKAVGATFSIGPLPTVMMDAEHCMQLFLLLMENALKFRAEGKAPDIKVSAEQQGQEWLFTVQDNGIGIDPQFHQRVFYIFQRLHTDQEYPGAGMGLTLAKKIVERHGGKIWVESAPGEGAAFKFTIPGRK